MELIAPDTPGFDDARATYNPQVDRRPALVALCQDEADVQAAVRQARAQGLQIAVRSCGHSVPGHSTVEGGLLIDLSALRDVEIDAAARRARVGPGLTAGEVETALAPHGLVAAAGLEPTPGYVGLALHGGRGLLGRRHGWSSDHIRGARLVTADGEVLVVSPDEHADVLYGLRGLGSSFGIVTELDVAVHPIPSTVFGGPRIYGPEQLRDVVPGVLALLQGSEVSDALDAMLTFFVDGGAPHLELHLLHIGTPAEAERDLAHIDALGAPLEDTTSRASYAEYLHSSDHPPLERYVWAEQGCDLPAEDLAAALLRAADGLPGTATDGIPNHFIVVEPLGRAFLRDPELPTPVPARDGTQIAFFGLWDDPSRDAEMNAWAASSDDELRRQGVGNDVPVLNYNSVTGPQAVRRAYGDTAYHRLRELKRRVDPDGVFLLNHGADLPD